VCFTLLVPNTPAVPASHNDINWKLKCMLWKQLALLHNTFRPECWKWLFYCGWCYSLPFQLLKPVFLLTSLLTFYLMWLYEKCLQICLVSFVKTMISNCVMKHTSISISLLSVGMVLIKCPLHATNCTTVFAKSFPC